MFQQTLDFRACNYSFEKKMKKSETFLEGSLSTPGLQYKCSLEYQHVFNKTSAIAAYIYNTGNE